MSDLSLHYLLPHLALVLGAMIVLVEGMILGGDRQGPFLVTALLAELASLYFAYRLWGEQGRAFSGALVIDGTVTAFLAVIAVATLLGTLVAPAYLNRYGFRKSDYYVLLLFSASGMQFLVSAGDLATLFVGLETLSVSVYALTGYRTRQDASNEAALKYFLLGAFATGFLLFGMAFLYGATGTTEFTQMAIRLNNQAGAGTPAYAALGLGLFAVGLAFKVGAVPFHMWVPDAYQGAPTPVTAFMSIAVKTAAVGILLRVVLGPLQPLADLWVPVVGALAIASMVAGNALALVQDNVKRMLAYSSVAHAGYLLLGVAAAAKLPSDASAAIVFYLLVYGFMNLGAFSVLMAVSRPGYERTRFLDLEGLSQERPLLAAALALFMLALAGIPPTGGFAAKFYLFASAIRADMPLLASLGILSSVIGVVYYLRVVMVMYMKPSPAGAKEAPVAARGAALTFAVVACALLTLELGLQLLPALGVFLPGYFQEFSSQILLAVSHQ